LTKKRNKLIRSLKHPESSRRLNEQSKPSTVSQPNRKSSRKKTKRPSLLLKKKSKRLPPTQPHLARLAVEARKEVERRAKHRPQTRLRWASSDPG